MMNVDPDPELVARDSAGDETPIDYCPECGNAHASAEECPLVDDPRYYPGEDMDGDAASALASAGFGTDEDYEHDTPLGDDYGGE